MNGGPCNAEYDANLDISVKPSKQRPNLRKLKLSQGILRKFGKVRMPQHHQYLRCHQRRWRVILKIEKMGGQKKKGKTVARPRVFYESSQYLVDVENGFIPMRGTSFQQVLQAALGTVDTRCSSIQGGKPPHPHNNHQ